MNILLIFHWPAKVNHLSLKPVHLSFMLALGALGLLKVSPLEPQVSPFKPQVTWGSNCPFATIWLKKRSNVLSWGSYVSTWGPNVITWCSNRLSWGSNVLNEGSNVLNWGSNVPTQSPNIPKFSHLFSVRTNFSHREIILKFSQWD